MGIHLRVPNGMAVGEDTMRGRGGKARSRFLLQLRHSLNQAVGWARTSYNELVKCGCVECTTDTCMYFKTDKPGMTVICV
ncbi:hypothetical protein PF008_g5506 [Phytophthora fragariae]|uniref:Uncharacterized protein n=1 Tax=Phytophthora fragariae TaxID=53985 RepID=A0A6G0S857_9STRA|nr:hypothetical protein PF008_g5506 [Phytophthora fragariae]